MSDFSTLKGRFRATPKENLPDRNTGKVTKRPRESHVCLQCRRSKLKCDRSQPCANCAKKGDSDRCTFPTLNSDRREASSSGGNRLIVAEDRLLHLESLVKQLIGGQITAAHVDSAVNPANPVTPPIAPTDSVATTQGIHNEALGYVGSTHWSAILDDIQQLKACIGESTDTWPTAEQPALRETSPSYGSRPELLFGRADDYTLDQILTEVLPPRVEVDRLLSIYFQGEAFIVPFIHSYRFQRQYRAFWADVTAVDPLWLSTLFSICCISTLIKAAQSQTASESSLMASISRLHVGAAQCLVLGEYHRPRSTAMEALGLYAQCKNLWTLGPSREGGAILGIVVRMAYEMGYHRDPDNLGSFTVFEGEMRRRFWSSCKQVDLMLSFQLGLPSSIRLENSDTKSPRNLLDSDFDEDTTVLPPSRSENEPARLLWFIVKDRQMSGFSKVCQDALSFREKTEAEVLQLDNEIQQMYSTVPEILLAKPLSESIMDPPFLIMTRLLVEFINLKSLIVLHRRYMVRGVLSSTIACINAGKRLVSEFINIYKEFAEGNQLYNERWMLTNFTMNDFLLGTMVLCLVVHVRRKAVVFGTESGIDAETESEILDLLQQARVICLEKTESSTDAKRVARAILVVVKGVPASARNGEVSTAEYPRDPLDMTALSLHPQGQQTFNPTLEPMTFDTLDPFGFTEIDFDYTNWTTDELQPSSH